jgi:hypothetical protein
MYIVVQHAISEPAAFWNSADPTTFPPEVKLHHTFPAPDGTRAVCIWEAASVEALRNVLEPLIGSISRNEYFTVENREGFARPSGVAATAEAAGTSSR